jgi:signal transduction histidine kinase
MLSFHDLASITAISLACALGVGALGLALLRLARRSSILFQVLVIVGASVASVAAGMSAVAQAMYVSAHDLLVTFFVAGISAVVSLGVALVLGRSATRNIRRIREAATALGAGERVEVTPDDGDTTELAQLARDLADTSRRLAEARDEVATIDASRRELMAWISHDLRTPLAGLRAMAEALEDGMADDPRRFHRQMRSQVDHLSSMVDDLFELSKIQSGTLVLSMEQLSLGDLISDALAELAPLAAARSIRLESPRHEPITMVGDARELSRVIGNLLINSIEHSPEGSVICVECSHAADGQVVLTVEDSGGGIPEHQLEKIFEPGWRASRARTPEPLWGRASGAGLGLAIVQGIVHAHSGEITVRNITGGCRFDVRLPREPAEAA